MKTALALVVLVACATEGDAPAPEACRAKICVQIPDRWITPCELARGIAGWCVVTRTGAAPSCHAACDSTPCPDGELAVPLVGDHCYCLPDAC